MLCCCLRVRIIKLRFKGCFVVYQGLAIQHWVNSGAGEEEEAFTQVLPIVPEDELGLGSSGEGRGQRVVTRVKWGRVIILDSSEGRGGGHYIRALGSSVESVII